MTNIKNFVMRFFDKELELRIRLFNVLATCGVGISVATFILNLFTGMYTGAIISAVLALLSAGLIFFTYRTGRYQTAYTVTIVTVFMIFFPMMFFESGAYKSGMPSLFIFAVLFTVLMLDGKRAIVTCAIEISEYIAVSVLCYLRPELVTWFATESEMLADILFTATAVSISCGAVLFLHLREYEAQRVKLAEQNEQLKRNDEAKTVFLTTVAHEIKNPLNAINLHARDTLELLSEDTLDAETVETMKENQRTVEKMVVRIDRIVVELMDTVAIEQGRLSLDLAPVRMSQLLCETAKTYFGKNDTGGNELKLELDGTLPPIMADGARIIQVVSNLLSNSIKHTKNGVITITLQKHPSGQMVCVSDNGEGMDERIKNKAFDGYISVSRDYWRHGIGLFVCRQIIEAHGGKIWIESEPGRGTTVSFILPSGEVKA